MLTPSLSEASDTRPLNLLSAYKAHIGLASASSLYSADTSRGVGSINPHFKEEEIVAQKGKTTLSLIIRLNIELRVKNRSPDSQSSW